SFTVQVEQSIPFDLIDCPADITLSVPQGQCQVEVNGIAPILLTNSANIQSIIYQLSGVNSGSGSDDASGLTFNLGMTRIRYTATAVNGQIDECSFTVTVIDDEAPAWTNCPTDMQLVLPMGQCEMVVNWVIPSASDNCTLANTNASLTPGTVLGVGTTIVSYTAFDNSGNSAQCSFSIQISDQEAPALNCPPSNISINSNNGCDAVVTWDDITATDNCPGVVLNGSHQSGDVFPVGTTTVLYIATDANGNVSNCSFDITIADQVPPVIVNCPSDITLESDAALCGVVYGWEGPTVNDNCGAFSIVCDPMPGSIFPVGTTTVVCTATDAAGNSSTCSFDVTVEDRTDPIISCGAAIQLSADGQILSDPDDVIFSANANGDCSGVAISFELPAASDNCTLNPSITQIDVSGLSNGSVFPIGTTVLQYQATDEAGNSTSCDFTISVIDLNVVTVSVAGNTSLCEDETLQLLSTPIAGASCEWTGPNGFSSTDPNPMISAISTAGSGTYQLICTLPNGCVRSGSIDIVVNERPIVNAMDDNMGGCNDQLALIAILGTSPDSIASYDWTGPNGFSSDEGDIFIDGIDSTFNGTYTLVTTGTNGCTSVSSVEFNLTILPAPQLDVACDTILCLDETCTLMGTQFAPVPDQYIWSSDRPGEDGLPDFTNTNELVVSPTDTGTYTYFYSVELDGCMSEVASMSITVAGAPEALDDVFTTDFEVTLEDMPILANDNFFETQVTSTTIVTNPQNGSLIPTADGGYSYIPQSGYIGTDQFVYQICYDCNDGQLCDIATVDINIEFQGDCQIPTLISPNNDGFNDELKILCIETGEFPNNDLLIFNQWGDQVFHAQPYMNNWDGTLNGEQGKDLPDGTYYYIFRRDEQAEVQKGFVTIFR
ncbi:MAG: HYR domain-containing protein, partial [Bacteroidota bacterium]